MVNPSRRRGNEFKALLDHVCVHMLRCARTRDTKIWQTAMKLAYLTENGQDLIAYLMDNDRCWEALKKRLRQLMGVLTQFHEFYVS